MEHDGLANRFLGMLGIGPLPHMLYTTFAVVLGHGLFLHSLICRFIPPLPEDG
ncbi:MAG: hypothetical protein V8Q32_04965 [Anaerotignum faecicola]